LEHTLQCFRQVLTQMSEVALDPRLPPDHHVVGTGEALYWNDFARQLAEAALHSVADDRAADLASDCEPNAHRRIAILALANEQDEAGSGRAHAAVGGDEIRAFADRD
jgi:hypothetical protein